MEQAEKLAALLQKLKANKEKVPIEVLKTKYKEPYEALCIEIKESGGLYLKQIAAEPPEWLKDLKVEEKYGEEIVGLFDKIYDEGNYAHKVGRAFYKNYSLTEAEALAREINKKYRAALLDYFQSKTCLYATAESFDKDNPKTPKIYNVLIRKFLNDETGTWEDPKPEDNVNAILIFIGEEKKRDGQNNGDYEEGTEPGHKSPAAGGHDTEPTNSAAGVSSGK